MFKILVNGVINTYSNFEDIPKTFENVISFKPNIIPGPHTPEEHIENAKWEERFKELMKRETK
jgi:hypothetical protein